jgi:serine protease Do
MKNKIHQLCGRLRVAVLAGALIAGAGALAFSPGEGSHKKAKESSNPPVKLSVDDSPVTRDSRGVTSFAPVIKKVTPSVVKVFVSTKGRATMSPSSMGPRGGMPDEFFRRFFGDSGDERELRTPKQHGLGSGVIVSKDGYILTNNHVVENADEIKVALSDGRELWAKVVGTDPKTDVALLKIDAKNLPFLQVADSDKLEVGDVVLAIGNPFGIGQTVTMGIVSATGRGNMGVDYEDFIQTDAAINPGNSGGALVDAEGRLIGINTAILSRTGGNQGIGFAIPVNLARYVMENLVAHGKVVRGYLGVGIQDVTPDLASQFDNAEARGALVGQVTAKSPADKAGIKSGDIVLEFNGKPVTDSRHLKLQVAQTAPGQAVQMKVMRDGKTKTLEVTPKEAPRDEIAQNKSEKGGSSDEHLQGVAVSDLDDTMRNRLRIPENVDGVLVSSVDEDSAAFEAGVRQGDVIQEINRMAVKSADDAVAAAEKTKGSRILLKIWSRGGSRYAVVNEANSDDKNG